MKGMENMVEITPSEILIQDVNRLARERTDIAAEIPAGVFLKGLPTGFDKKTLFAAHGDTLEKRANACLALLAFIDERKLGLKTWLILARESGCLITDPPTARQLTELQDFAAE